MTTQHIRHNSVSDIVLSVTTQPLHFVAYLCAGIFGENMAALASASLSALAVLAIFSALADLLAFLELCKQISKTMTQVKLHKCIVEKR